MPWPQKGADVTIPLGQVAPVKGIGKANQQWSDGAQTVYNSEAGTSSFANSSAIGESSYPADSRFYVEEDPDNTGYPHIYADLSSATSATMCNGASTK